jgi:hypothetical protein
MMFGRIFGRGKDEPDQAVCAQCGRTLLVGEWTQNVVGADGQEYLICSLCGQSASVAEADPGAIGTTPANNGRVRESRSEVFASSEHDLAPLEPAEPAVMPAAAPVAAAGFVAATADRDPVEDKRDARSESDAFWRALKEKDAEIDRLQAVLAGVEAEKQELAAQLAAARSQTGGTVSAAPGAVPREPLVPAGVVATVLDEQPPAADAEPGRVDASEPGERTWGETPAEFAGELAALRSEEAAIEAQAPAVEEVQAEQAALVTPAAVPAIVFENTQPIPAISDDMIAADMVVAAGPSPADEAETTLTPETGAPLMTAAVAAEALSTEPLVPQEPSAAELEAEAASLMVLQRGVDLFNVSRIPHKIAETSEQLGQSQVHVGSEGHITVVTFMWSMGWYRYEVDAETDDVRLADRGYEERGDLRPNAGVRADGTVQLAPAQISRAAKAPAGQEPEPLPAAGPPPVHPAEPEPPSVAAQKAPEILSKSLLGQRSDDDVASWEQTQARDFDWNR